MFFQTEFIDDTIRRCTQMEPNEFKIHVNQIMNAHHDTLSEQGLSMASVPVYKVGTWNWYIASVRGKHVGDLLKFAGFGWTPISKEKSDEAEREAASDTGKV